MFKQPPSIQLNEYYKNVCELTSAKHEQGFWL